MTSISVVALVFVSVCYSTVLSHTLISVNEIVPTNNRPIIGILAQEVSYRMERDYPGQYNSYIAASYVKFIEGAGARVVPIWIGQNDSYYEDMISKINGILWPGGATFFNNSNGYADAGEKIYRIAKRINKEGDYFPIMGICLGFELLIYLQANRHEHRIDCNSINQPLPLEFKSNFRNSRMFKNAPAKVIEILQHEYVTANYHRYCVRENDISRNFRVLSLNHDLDGLQFVSTIEHISRPFYGLQFHPEKNLYEWVTGKKIPHGHSATQAAQYFANFFVDEARKNRHQFPSANEAAARLIYNYPTTYTGLTKSAFQQCYMFKKRDYIH